ncbi:MAG TPA: ethanolamine ammonia-lyase subunit EutC [Terriglobales bacterium]|nr:ethanolamine ammonia-lyase subunit EutC [Terriglobales bacterium]
MTDKITQQWPEIVRHIRRRTPARVLSGRAGSSYLTQSQLELREAHAAAVDAVRNELDLASTLGAAFCERWKLFEVSTEASSKSEFLVRPDLGRRLSQDAREKIRTKCQSGVDLQIAIGDGLSVAAVAAQVPQLLPLLMQGAARRGWFVGQPFVIRHCRVGVLNDIGEVLSPAVAVLLIGERPGLATAESLSAYLAFRPNRNHSDADRNLISNIHARGTTVPEAATRVLDMVSAMMVQQISGTKLTLASLKP